MALDQDKLNSLKLDKSKRYERKSSGHAKWIGMAIGLALLSFAGYKFFNSQKAELPVVEVHKVVKPSAVDVPVNDAVLNASGYVVARRQATVSSKVTGKIREVLVEEGMQVEQGQVLALLDDSTLVAQIALAESQKRAAETSLDEVKVRISEAQKNLDRSISLRASKLIPQSNLDSAEAELAALKARLSNANSDIRVSNQNLALQKQYQSDYTIVAPFAGVVITKNAQPGEMISPAATGGSTRTGICTLVDMDSREIEVDVNESFINKVSAGQDVEAVLDAYPDWTIPAKVINIVPTADRQKATVKVRIGFNELDNRILTDMGVRVTFLADELSGSESQNIQEPKIRIPIEVIFNEDGIDKVLVVNSNGVPTIRDIKVESKTLNNAVIQNGLSGGEQLIVNPEPFKNQKQVSIQ